MKKNYMAPDAEWLAFTPREALMGTEVSGMGQDIGGDPVDPEHPVIDDEQWG